MKAKGIGYSTVAGFWFWVLLVVLVFPWVSFGQGESSTNTAAVRYPLVVFKQAEISGRIFYLRGEKEEEAVASDVRLEIHDIQTGARIYQTDTDDQGYYKLPGLEAGVFKLKIGRLILQLKVDASEVDASGIPIPKTLLIFIPRDIVM